MVIGSFGLFVPTKTPLEYIPLGELRLTLVVPIIRLIVVAAGIPAILLVETVAPFAAAELSQAV